MGGAALAWLLVPLAGALAVGAAAQPHPRFHHGARLPLSDRDGRARLQLGQARAARPRFLAVSLWQIRTALGARPVQATDQSAGSARPQPLTAAGLLGDTAARDYTRKLQLFNDFAAPE